MTVRRTSALRRRYSPADVGVQFLEYRTLPWKIDVVMANLQGLGGIIRNAWVRPVKFFSKLSYFIFGYLDPTNIFLIVKINNVWGDLSDVSAITATLGATFPVSFLVFSSAFLLSFRFAVTHTGCDK